jgi:MerR family copper efflux transcriptional regulator
MQTNSLTIGHLAREAGINLESSAEIRRLAESKIADVQSKIKSLESIEKTLRKLTKSCDGCGPIAECPILESLDKGGI